MLPRNPNASPAPPHRPTAALTFLPAWLADAIANAGLDVALDLLMDLTRPYTGKYFYEEMQGLADGAGEFGGGGGGGGA